MSKLFVIFVGTYAKVTILAQKENQFQQILQQMQLRQFAPFYLLAGAEPYFIDRLAGYLEANLLNGEEKQLNLTVAYGKDADMDTLIATAREFPLLAGQRLVMLKEAQTMDRREETLAKLEAYLHHPCPTTVFVVTYKGSTPDARHKWVKAAAQVGVCYEAPVLYESEMPGWIQTLAKQKGLTLEPAAQQILVDYLGTDLQRIDNTLERLKVQTGGRTVGRDDVTACTGIAKHNNGFDLQDALIVKDRAKCMRIAMNNTDEIYSITAVLSGYFSQLLAYEYARDKSEAGLRASLRVSPYQLRKLQTGARYYNRMQTFKAIGYLREYDARSKGFGGVNVDADILLRELVYKILNA